jgi:hypothetical protein
MIHHDRGADEVVVLLMLRGRQLIPLGHRLQSSGPSLAGVRTVNGDVFEDVNGDVLEDPGGATHEVDERLDAPRLRIELLLGLIEFHRELLPLLPVPASDPDETAHSQDDCGASDESSHSGEVPNFSTHSWDCCTSR